MSTIEHIFQLMVDKKASDIYLSANCTAMIKIQGRTVPINTQIMPLDAPLELLAEVLSPAQLEELQTKGELNLSLPMPGMGNFRISAFRQRGTYAAVVRYISPTIPSLSELNLPANFEALVMQKRGLVLVVGATGSGKSTTIASMLDHRNATSTGHILTIEDPIEFIFENKKSVVNQRELGRDALSLNLALKNALHQAPDVIFIGEIRDQESMSAAISYGQSGQLCFATLHANNSYQALNRILSFYPAEVRPMMLSDLSSSLQAIISQRLIRTATGSRVPAVEIMINSKAVTDLIAKGAFTEIKEAIEKSADQGSQSFEQDIARMINQNIITRKEGLLHADSTTNLMWRLENDFSGATKTSTSTEEEEPDDTPNFTEISLNIKPEHEN